MNSQSPENYINITEHNAKKLNHEFNPKTNMRRMAAVIVSCILEFAQSPAAAALARAEGVM